MYRKIYLENELKQRLDLMSKKHFFHLPDGFGFSQNLSYSKVGSNYVQDSNVDAQSIINGEMVFYENPYDNFKSFIDYVEGAESLKLVYVPNYNIATRKEFFRDVDVSDISKSEVKMGVLRCPIFFNCKSLFYSEDTRKFIIESIADEPRFDIAYWGITFNDYNDREIIINNTGHVDAAMKIEMFGYLINPKIYVYHNEKLIGKLEINDTIEEKEKFLYSTSDHDLYLYKLLEDGSRVNLLNTIDLQNENFFKLPKGTSIIKITAENGVETKTTLDVLIEYKAV